ncbi:MAG: S8 family serine peptidase [bacterium]|nr:S8 family serine peptidase [bacterium]
MKIAKKVVIFSIFFLLTAFQARAFSNDYTPSEPGLVYQSYLDMANIYPSWSNDLKTNKEVVVAVLDSGVDLDHPDLVDSIWKNSGEIASDGLDNDKNSYIDDFSGWDFVASDNNPEPDLIEGYDYTAINHGTIVAGIIAASLNGTGIIGIAPRAKIMPLKILNEKGVGNTLVLAQAIDYAVENGADIINLSLVGSAFDENLKKSINNAYNRGVMIVAASGNESNEGISLDLSPRYPVCEMNAGNQVLGVAAVDENKRMPVFSNYGASCIDLSAPGTNFYSTVYNNVENTEFTSYYKGGWSGTSVAAPIVSATAALIKMNFSDLRPYDIYHIIINSTSDLQKANPDNYADLGSGLVDIGAALNMARDYVNGSIKIILAPEKNQIPEILILDQQGNLESSFLAYSQNFMGGVALAVGDVNGDGQEEIITAPQAGGGPHIRVFDLNGQVLSEFFAYDFKFTGGVKIALGDVNGDGQKEIITAPQAGGGPHIRVFDYQGKVLSEFFAYESNFSGGVNIASGDVNNDSKDEIVVAPASNREPEIKVFDTEHLKSSFMAYDKSVNSGLNITVGDVNNDTWPEIVAVPAKNSAPNIKMFSYRGRLKGEFLAYSEHLLSGIKILAKDISGDSLPEIITLPNRGAASLMRIYDSLGLEKDNFYVRNVNDKNGYYFEILSR